MERYILGKDYIHLKEILRLQGCGAESAFACTDEVN
jgi:hypothetical protein